MKASFLDLRRRMRDVLRALDRNEPVTLLYRGRKKAVMYPIADSDDERRPLTEHPAFGIWMDRKEMQNVAAYVRRLRQRRTRAL